MFKHTAYFTVTRILFEFRKPRTKSAGDAPLYGVVYARIIIEGQQRPGPIATSIRCTRSDWDKRSKSNAPLSAKDLVKCMVKWEESIYSAAKTLYDQGEPITAQTLVQEKNSKAANLITLVDVYKAYLSYKKGCIGSDNSQERDASQISLSTFKTYTKRWLFLESYLKLKGQMRMFAYKADGPFVQAYFTWLKSKNLAAATATKYAKLLTVMLHWAVNNGLVKNMTVQGFQGGSADVLKPPHNVTEEEVRRIEALDFGDSIKMQGIRDGWLLARELCLHFSDYIALKSEHFTLNKDNRAVFEKLRQKQEAARYLMQTAYVSERGLSIWKRYGCKPPYVCSNPEFNLCLKQIGYMAGLQEPLMFSHARDSGIFQWVATGVPDAQTCMAAGWRNTKPLVRYVNFNRRLLDQFSAPKTQDTFSPSTPIVGTPFAKLA